MKTRVSVYDFRNAFMQSDTYKNSFTYEGLAALFEYLEQYEEDTNEEIDFDMVALACEYSEYTSAWEAMEQYQSNDMPVVDLQAYSDEHNGEGMDLIEVQEAQEKMALEWLEERTQVIPFEKGILIQQF